MKQLSVFINKHYQKIFYSIAILVFVLLSVIVTFKYFNFQYNALDLGIFTDVLKHSSQGNFFYSSIQQTNYLGDHFSPILLLWLPDFLLFESPLLLIIEQVLFLVLSGVLFFVLAKKKLSPSLSLLIGLAYLFNPYLWNQSVFEFSPLCLLPLGIMLLFWSLEKKLLSCFIVFLLFCLFLREDVSLLTGMLGLFLLTKNNRQLHGSKFSLLTVILSGAYFAVSMGIISIINNGGNKFFGYYENIIANLFNLNQVELIIGALLPVGFLILFRGRWLIPLILIYLEFALLGGQGSLVWQMHYSAFFYPIIYLGVMELFAVSTKEKQQFFGFVLVLATVYCFIILSPVLDWQTLTRSTQEKQSINSMLQLIPENSKVLASSEFLAPLATQNEVYSLNYAFLEVKQFGRGRYELPSDLSYLLINDREWLDYESTYKDHAIYSQYYSTGKANIVKLLKNFSLVNNYGHYYLFKKNETEVICPTFSNLIDENGWYQVENLETPIPGWWVNETFGCRVNHSSRTNITPVTIETRGVGLNKMGTAQVDYSIINIGQGFILSRQIQK